ncbi:HxlR family transcriptional regulator [Rhodococcus sp. Leaf7]|uniref:winged helix-turn-helix transcriptional regulator n=1 Tax=unclassified Rhodococcus (in: high G+C Gram-positive bacteria) TaxID=192944 RepID=UPI0005ABCAD0|nr:MULTISPECIES: helix-turn-helix domain-containing protein [unclassified Rhodococcus (in: high G+C Gram-positive bacteria)]KIQ07961.1 HxlR family transcriptional regulator [Rhodococcus sp. MEB064]KQU02409.1 HxlR family transcriptional regulator [Rhodococcus sp. Leaf7]KQU37880.1 HxlR family transcriptional regulator [Rhodococcus sp. Leaf247]
MTTPVWNVLLEDCPSRTSLARIANKWTAMIVIALGDDRVRFGELRTQVGGISAKVLADTLRDLERDGIVARHAYDQMPPKVEYELTDLGRTLHDPLQALRTWAEAHYAQVSRAREMYDREKSS